jgi:hypothetical protein
MSPTIFDGVPVAPGDKYAPEIPADVIDKDPPPSALRAVFVPNVREVEPEIKSRHIVGEAVAKLAELAPSSEKVGVEIVAA